MADTEDCASELVGEFVEVADCVPDETFLVGVDAAEMVPYRVDDDRADGADLEGEVADPLDVAGSTISSVMNVTRARSAPAATSRGVESTSIESSEEMIRTLSGAPNTPVVNRVAVRLSTFPCRHLSGRRQGETRTPEGAAGQATRSSASERDPPARS